MARLEGPVISAAVEGLVDEAVARKLILAVEAVPGSFYGKNGKDYLRQKIGGFSNAARFSPWLVLVDLDHDAECAPELRRRWLTPSPPRMCFRIAVRQIEAWLLADSDRIAEFLRVSRARIPLEPEKEAHAKRKLIDIARSSRSRAIREDIVPRVGSGRGVGPAYTSRLIEFVDRKWRPEVAAEKSDSLSRCLARLKLLAFQS